MQIALDGGAAQLLLQCLRSPHVQVREQALLALQALAMHHAHVRNTLLGAGALHAAIEQMTDTVPLPLLRKTVSLLAVLCGASHPPAELPPWDTVRRGCGCHARQLRAADCLSRGCRWRLAA
jgi:hypothetical protein